MTMESRQEVVFPLIDGLAAYAGSPSVAVSAPSNSGSTVVEQILSSGDVAEIAKSVVSAVTVDVVNVHRLFVVNKEPRQPVNKVLLSVDGDTHVPSRRFGGLATKYLSCVGVVLHDIAHRIRNNFRSHVVPLYDVVRGLVVGATSTPILSRFASSGGRYGDPKGHSSYKHHRHPFKERR